MLLNSLLYIINNIMYMNYPSLPKSRVPKYFRTHLAYEININLFDINI